MCSGPVEIRFSLAAIYDIRTQTKCKITGMGPQASHE